MIKTLIDDLNAKYWLMKTEPDVFSIFDLEQRPGQREFWDGVRNYQARNFMKDQMKIGDKILFYHSNSNPSGVAGIAEVVEEAKPDNSALDPKSKYFDPKATKDNPRWFAVTVGKPKKFSHIVALAELRENPILKEMILLKKGQRLSILPVSQKEYEAILLMAGYK